MWSVEDAMRWQCARARARGAGDGDRVWRGIRGRGAKANKGHGGGPEVQRSRFPANSPRPQQQGSAGVCAPANTSPPFSPWYRRRTCTDRYVLT